MLIAFQSINDRVVRVKSGDEPKLWGRAINGFDRCANVAQVNETIDWPFVEGRGRCNPTAVLKWNYFDIGFDRLPPPLRRERLPRCLFEKPLYTEALHPRYRDDRWPMLHEFLERCIGWSTYLYHAEYLARFFFFLEILRWKLNEWSNEGCNGIDSFIEEGPKFKDSVTQKSKRKTIVINETSLSKI